MHMFMKRSNTSTAMSMTSTINTSMTDRSSNPIRIGIAMSGCGTLIRTIPTCTTAISTPMPARFRPSACRTSEARAIAAAAVLAAAVLGLTLLARSRQEESGKPAELTVTQKESSAARRPRDAQGNSGANPDVTKTQESFVAPTSSHGDAARPSPEILNATRSSDGVEASLLAFLRGETSPPTMAARFNLDQVQFDARRTAPRPASRRQLLAVAQILSTYPKARVFIGHEGGGDRAAAPRIVKARLLSVRRELDANGRQFRSAEFEEATPNVKGRPRPH